MRVGDVSRARRFANPARLRWYAFHRSVRFALRMMKVEHPASSVETLQLQLLESCQLVLNPEFNEENLELRDKLLPLAPTSASRADPISNDSNEAS